MHDISKTTVGGYLATRLEQIGIADYFVVPGDYNLVLLDELLANDRLRMISCCNELNAGYAADGYSRATGGPSAAVVTFTVGGLSLINAIGGAYAEDLPVIAISGGPNTNSQAEYELLHHTLGKVDYAYQREMYSRVTANAVIIQNAAEAPTQIDHAIETALLERKPVYLEIACNIAAAATSIPHDRSFPTRRASDEASLNDAVEHAVSVLSEATKPVLVAGVKLRPCSAQAEFASLAESSGYAVAAMPNAKGMFSEEHPTYMGIYWGPVGSPGCGEIVESSDMAIFCGATFTDYTTVGHATLAQSAKMIQVEPNRVVVKGESYNNVIMSDFLSRLAERVKRNEAS
ncbi:MAG: pyruvate decarboxylase, partial [Pirellulales bacterium]|nr:pyruvate decarboxylase [Pirellulales bacterium]